MKEEKDGKSHEVEMKRKTKAGRSESRFGPVIVGKREGARFGTGNE